MRKLLKVLTTLALMGSMCMNVCASELSDLQSEKKEQEDKKKEAQEIVDQLKADKGGILDAIAALDAQVEEYNEQIAELEIEKAELEASIAETEAELADAQGKETDQYNAMKERIKYSYENGNITYFDTLFSSTDISDLVNRAEYVEQIYNYDSAMLAELISIKITIANTKQKLETDLASAETIEEELAENKEAVQIMIDGKKDQIENYDLYIDDYEELIASIEAEMSAIEDKIAAAEEAARQNGDVVVNYTGGTFQWPVATGGTVTSHYGPRSMFGRSFHYGIDIGCSTGTPIVAGEAGTVIVATYSSVMGNYIVIDHGGGVSTIYMHNSALVASAGQQVARGELIAYAGDTGQVTAAHCHFGVRINGSYVDPYPYLVQ